ncbi:MAG: isopentenyl-diphosphate delta-isomerase [Rhodothermales bacterium]|jgi:isopentenyl-diphosphate delta-isomerase
MNSVERVVLVDKDDVPVGEMEKMEAHRLGVLHRAISVFVFDRKGDMLLQRRAAVKYHSPGLWTNTCCSHPRPNEDVQDAASRRLGEEMGLACELHRRFSFTYRAEFEGGLIEHELDHVFVGRSDDVPRPHPDEVSDWRYASVPQVRSEMELHPERFTPWFRICFERAVSDAVIPPVSSR